MVIGRFGEALLSILYPPRCPICNRILPVKEGYRICEDCIEDLPYISDPRCEHCSKPLDDEYASLCFDCSKARL